MDEPGQTPFDTELWLRSLAGDILEHEGCESCRVNAAEALERLGGIEGTLARLGVEDPRRSRERALDGQQARAAAGRPPRVRLDLQADLVVAEPAGEFQARITSAVRDAVARAIGEVPGVRLGNFTMAITTEDG